MLRGLEEFGYIEGQNSIIESRSRSEGGTDGTNRVSFVTAELCGKRQGASVFLYDGVEIPLQVAPSVAGSGV
jgi:hypothetical protein